VLRLQLQGALLPVFVLPADLLAALQLQSKFSNLLEEKGTPRQQNDGSAPQKEATFRSPGVI